MNSAAFRGPGQAGHHGVRFYDDSRTLCISVADFLGDGLAAGQPIVLIATQPHRELLVAELLRRGFPLDRLIDTGEATVLDAEHTLDRIMKGDAPDTHRFGTVIGAVLSAAAHGREHCTPRAFGEMVDILWRRGNREGAIRLEILWNNLASRLPLSLVCGYQIGGFYKQTGDLERVCGLHTQHHLCEEHPA